MEEVQKQKELAKADIQKVLKEKGQLTADLSSMEKSFSDLLKRFEKRRYRALKAHAEEKLQLANEEVAQVRSKAQAEALAPQASLRKGQMRVQSLERTVEEKTKENEELTGICDGLSSKMAKI
ncbi:Transforming acidic coiled-coil-containing protein 3 [Plecturocebus cupreus]